MKMKTESDVSITIVSEGSSKILLFDKLVCAIELKKRELSQLGALLASDLETHPVKSTKTISPEG